jgi:hypothetical protein
MAGYIVLSACAAGARAQSSSAAKLAGSQNHKSAAASQRVSLAPRFVPGQTFRYQMEFETTTHTSRSGLTVDPEGPTSLVVDWTAAVRMEVLAAGADTPGGIRLRTTYEKSSATINSDTFDPAAAETSEQYRSLEGKVVEFTIDASGNVKYVAGIEGLVDSQKAAQSAREWIAQISASGGAPPGGVTVGQKWTSEQPADSLPIAGLVWRTDSEYLRNEPCHPPNPDVPDAAPPGENARAAPDCAVVLANLSLIRSKTARELTPAELRKNGVTSAGKWTGSAQSLVYVSLDTGMVVSATQTSTENMDVTLTSNRDTSLRYAGTIASRSHVTLLENGDGGK